MRFLRPLLALTIAVTTLTGDYIVFQSKYSRSQLFRALTDSLTHATIGLLSSLAFFSNEINASSQAVIYNTLLCTFIASLIDIDHFILARSLSFKDITNLKSRGVFHCTTPWIILTAILLIYSSMIRKNNVLILTYMIIIAYTSHHIRDGHRRGLWFYPFGSTGPLHLYLYVTLLVILPFILAYTYKLMRYQQFNVDYTIV